MGVLRHDLKRLSEKKLKTDISVKNEIKVRKYAGWL